MALLYSLCVSLCCSSCLTFFFFKQKTAYEMRISDWSSDVCSSDLCVVETVPRPADCHASRKAEPPSIADRPIGRITRATRQPFAKVFRSGRAVFRQCPAIVPVYGEAVN